MSVIEDLKKLGTDTEVWVVKMCILYYLRGAESSLLHLGDEDRSVFHEWTSGYVNSRQIKTPEDYFRNNQFTSNLSGYRGLICAVMDDLGFRDPEQRDRILEKLTGVSRAETLEMIRLHRISQGDFWLKKEGE